MHPASLVKVLAHRWRHLSILGARSGSAGVAGARDGDGGGGVAHPVDHLLQAVGGNGAELHGSPGWVGRYGVHVMVLRWRQAGAPTTPLPQSGTAGGTALRHLPILHNLCQ